MADIKKRKDYLELEGALQAEANRLINQARFIMEKCSGEIVIENKKIKTIVDELIKRQYPPDPVKEWKQRMQAEEAEEDSQEEDEEAGSSKKKPDVEKAFSNLSDVKKFAGHTPTWSAVPHPKKFDYLLGLSMWMLTDEGQKELLRQRDNKLAELGVLRRKKQLIFGERI